MLVSSGRRLLFVASRVSGVSGGGAAAAGHEEQAGRA